MEHNIFYQKIFSKQHIFFTQTKVTKNIKNRRIRKRFYITSKNLEKKPQFNLGKFSFPQHQPFSLSKQPEEKQKQVKQITHTITQLYKETKEADETCSSPVDLEVQSFQLDEYGIVHISGTKPPERDQEAEKGKLQANGESEKQEEIESRLISQERDLNVFWNISQSQNSQSQNQNQKYREIDSKLAQLVENQQTLQKQIESRDQKQDKPEIQEIKVDKPLYKREVKFCYYRGSRELL